MPGIRAWGDDLVLVLFEFLDDDTKPAQSCTDWLYVQRWYIVVPDPTMRVTLWAVMGYRQGLSDLPHNWSPGSFFRLFSVSAGESGTGNSVLPWHLRRHGVSCVMQSMARRLPLPAHVRRDAPSRLAL